VSEPIIVKLRGCHVEVWPSRRFLRTVFPDQTFVPAAPNFDAGSIALAHELGYDGDTWRLSLWHEVCHTLLSEHEGRPHSPTLWAVAHDVVARRGVIHDEEQRVLAVQRLIMRGDAGERAAWLEGIPDLSALAAKARATLLPLESVASRVRVN
jgi:hypothetical protein